MKGGTPATRATSHSGDKLLPGDLRRHQQEHTNPCVIKGFPSDGWRSQVFHRQPDRGLHNDLKVIPEGNGLRRDLFGGPGDGAIVSLTFRQAPGGKCASGACRRREGCWYCWGCHEAASSCCCGPTAATSSTCVRHRTGRSVRGAPAAIRSHRWLAANQVPQWRGDCGRWGLGFRPSLLWRCPVQVPAR